MAPRAHRRTLEKSQNSIRGSSFFALTRRTASAAHEAEEQTKELKSRPLEASENRRSTRAKKLPNKLKNGTQTGRNGAEKVPKCPLGRPAGGSGRLSAPSWAAGGIWRRSRGILGGLREGSRGGVGRLQGRFSLFGGGQDGLRGSFWQTFSDILSKSVWQTRGRAENASKNALVQPGTRQFLNVLSSLRLARFGTTGAQTDI